MLAGTEVAARASTAPVPPGLGRQVLGLRPWGGGGGPRQRLQLSAANGVLETDTLHVIAMNFILCLLLWALLLALCWPLALLLLLLWPVLWLLSLPFRIVGSLS